MLINYTASFFANKIIIINRKVIFIYVLN